MKSEHWITRTGDRILTFFCAFFVTLIALGLASAATESFTPLTVEPKELRFALFWLIVLVSIISGVFFARRDTKTRSEKNPQHSGENVMNSKMNHAHVSPNEQAPAVIDRVLQKAQYRPIVFRELYPPPADPGLSFYGGQPIGPKGMQWPHAETKRGRVRLHFVMQWGCAELSAQDTTGLLPHDGALYLFADLQWGDPLAFRFMHAAGPVADWAPLSIPHDLGSIFPEGLAWQAPYIGKFNVDTGEEVSQLSPRWPFKPIAIDYPIDTRGSIDEEDFEYEYWMDDSGVGEALLAAQKSVVDPPLPAPLTLSGGNRPFPAFPHDWAAVRIVCAQILKKGSASAIKEAREQYARASQYDLKSTVPQDLSDEIWAWMESRWDSLDLMFEKTLEKCVNISLGIGSEATASIPPMHLATHARQHVLANESVHDETEREFVQSQPTERAREDARGQWKLKVERGEINRVRRIHAPTPNHMFGPPSSVQGDVGDFIEEYLLLLELSSQDSIGMYLGEGVIQLLIKPDDLQAGRFDKLEVIITAIRNNRIQAVFRVFGDAL